MSLAKKAITSLANFIFHSDLIEGIGGTRRDLEAIRWAISSREETGHVGAMLMLEALAQEMVNQYVDKKILCQIQRLITENQHLQPGGHRLSPEHIGRYRRVGVKVYSESRGYRVCPSPEKVPALMKNLIGRINWWQQNARFLDENENLRYVAGFHYHFLKIHPFADGNGRTARALTYYLLRFNCMPPFVFASEDKFEAYYPCFDDDTPNAMLGYFKQKYSPPSGDTA